MRTTEQLEKIAELAEILRQERGDSKWSDVERKNVDLAHDLLRNVKDT